jgi:predicted DNA-binding transcriptional regulator AlpA
MKPLSVSQVAEKLGVTPRSILRFADEGKLPKPLVIGSRLKWLPSQIDDWIQGQLDDQVEKADEK